MRRRDLWLVVLCVACRRRRSPEDEVRARLVAFERAVEDKDRSAVRDALTETFRGPDGMDRAQVMAALHVQFLRHAELHLFVRVHTVELRATDQARAEVFAALTGVPVVDDIELLRLEADVYRFDIELTNPSRDADGWRITGASWEPVRPGAWRQ